MKRDLWVLIGLIAVAGAIDASKRVEQEVAGSLAAEPARLYGFGVVPKKNINPEYTNVGIMQVDKVDCGSAASIAGLKSGDVIFHSVIYDEKGNIVRDFSISQTSAKTLPLTAYVTVFRPSRVGFANRTDVPLRILPLSGEKC